MNVQSGIFLRTVMSLAFLGAAESGRRSLSTWARLEVSLSLLLDLNRPYHKRMELCPPGGMDTRDVGRSVMTLKEFVLLEEAKALLEMELGCVGGG